MEGQLTAPDFPDGLEWLNTERPLSLRELRGKVVLLDFWTYCCINCMHILPDLKRLERKYANELVVIGVHSAKFFTEQETENVRQAILRYEIEHPVVNDNQMVIWSQYAVRAWPTLVLIDPQGKIVGYHSGEGIYEIFDKAIQQVIQTFEARGQLDRTPLRFKLERERTPRTVLHFPGKVLADETSQRLFIADSNHHRILVVSLKDNTIQKVIGSGEAGFADGAFDKARFRNPQGMAYDPKTETLYIADTDNHAIRKADLRREQVETLAGTGEQSRVYPPRPGKGKEVALNSPWDVVLLGDRKDGLLVAAGRGVDRPVLVDRAAEGDQRHVRLLEIGAGPIRPLDDIQAGRTTISPPSTWHWQASRLLRPAMFSLSTWSSSTDGAARCSRPETMRIMQVPHSPSRQP